MYPFFNAGELMNDLFFSSDIWMLILGGLQTTIVIFVFAAILAILLGAGLSYLNISKRWPWLYNPLEWFVSTVHEVPAIAFMMFFYYVVFVGEMNGIVVSIIALGIYASDSLEDVFNVQIRQVDKGQVEAGLALGLTKRQCYQHIVLPQAVKSMLPLLAGELRALLQATSYAGYIAQHDLMKVVDTIREQYNDTLLPLIVVSILYLILAWIITTLVKSLYAKLFRYD